MIRIAPEELVFAQRLSKIRRRPKPSHGGKSWPHCHQLIYSGGNKLTFRTTDLRISIISELPIEGDDDPWECRILQHNFDLQAKFADGGRYTLNPRPARCVRAEKKYSTVPRNAMIKPPVPRGEDSLTLTGSEEIPTLSFENGILPPLEATPPAG